MEETGCWNCGSTDHYKRDCPQFPSRQHNRSGNRNELDRRNIHVISNTSDDEQYHLSSLAHPEPESEGCYESDGFSGCSLHSLPPSHCRLHHIPDLDDESDSSNLNVCSIFISDDVLACNSVSVPIPTVSKVGLAAHTWCATEKIDCPGREKALRSPIMVKAQVNGVGATVLIDSGAEVDLDSPDFLENCSGPEIYCLKEPLGLGMAVEGSAASINYGAYLQIGVGSFSTRHYFDVQQCQKVDIILGIPFMSKYDMSVNFGRQCKFTIGILTFSDHYELPPPAIPKRKIYPSPHKTSSAS
jgi:hypothetical protein